MDSLTEAGKNATQYPCPFSNFGNPMGMGIGDKIGNGNGKEWVTTCMGMGMALPMGINSHRPGLLTILAKSIGDTFNNTFNVVASHISNFMVFKST